MIARHRTFSVGISLVLLNGCQTTGPIYSLSPAVRESTVEYGDVMADYSDRTLMMNVLRAKDGAPLNFNDLASITGAFSLQGSLGLTLPYGYSVLPIQEPLKMIGNGGTAPYNQAPYFKNTASPTITGSSSPTASVTSLNTQAFMMTMIQPVSTSYVASKWDSYPHKFLLYLFVKSIRFAKLDENDIHPQVPYVNDPDRAEFKDFSDLVDEMVDSGELDLKSLTVLDPLGNPLPAGRTLSALWTDPAMTAPMLPDLPASPHGTQLPKGRYFIKVSFVTGSGETLPSPEEMVDTTTGPHAGEGFRLALTAIDKSNAVAGGYNVYVGTTAGNEMKQNSQPIPLVGFWDVNSTTLASGTTAPLASAPQYTVASEYNIFQMINGLNDGQLHVGNFQCPKFLSQGSHSAVADLCPGDSKFPFIQIYKEYLAQVVLCVTADENGYLGAHKIVSITSEERTARANLTEAENRALQALRMASAAASDREKPWYGRLPSLPEIDPTDTVAKASLPGQLQEYAEAFEGRGNPLPSTTFAALKQELDSKKARLHDLQEKADQAQFAGAMQFAAGKNGGAQAPGAPPSSAIGAGSPSASGGSGANGTGAMSQVTLALQPSRVSALVRNPACNRDEVVLTSDTEPEYSKNSGTKFTHVEWRSIAEVIQYLGALARYTDRRDHTVGWTAPGGSGTTEQHTLFNIAKKLENARISVDYRGEQYGIAYRQQSPHFLNIDHSLDSLTLLNELISIAKGGSVSAPQPIQVLAP